MTKNLTPREMRKLEQLILSEPRDIKQLNVDSSLWTATIVAKLIEVQLGKVLKE
jgi:hypothetical protein